jgi:hypothetical protein
MYVSAYGRADVWVGARARVCACSKEREKVRLPVHTHIEGLAAL